MMRDRCKVCNAERLHEQRTDAHGREAWWCVCGASKHMLSREARPVPVAA
jgi:hypothetical protein